MLNVSNKRPLVSYKAINIICLSASFCSFYDTCEKCIPAACRLESEVSPLPPCPIHSTLYVERQETDTQQRDSVQTCICKCIVVHRRIMLQT